MMSWIELAATVCGFLCVVLTIYRSVWCWPVGLVQVLLFIVVFYDAKLYSDLLLHVIYVFLQFYGWYCWTRKDAAKETLVVERLASRGLIGCVLITATGTAVLGSVMARWTDAALPYPDAFTTVASLVAQFLLARRFLENWGFWISVDLVAVWVYLTKELHATAFLYSAFLVLACIGLWAWRQRLRKQNSGQELA